MGKMALDRHCYSTFVVATKQQIATKQHTCYILPFCCYRDPYACSENPNCGLKNLTVNKLVDCVRDGAFG